jgi:hypothetical protein
MWSSATSVVPSSSSSSQPTKSEADYREEMRLVRLEQQELALQRAHEAEKHKKEKAAKERERKNAVAQTGNMGNILGGGTAAASAAAYSPMQPWSQNSGGGGYR